jgi:hypothetical protein
VSLDVRKKAHFPRILMIDKDDPLRSNTSRIPYLHRLPAIMGA